MLTEDIIIFDGNCAFCRGWVDRLRRWGIEGVEFVPAERRHEVAGLPPIDSAALDGAMHLVRRDGRIFSGGAAVAEALRHVPAARPLGALLALPGFRAATAVADRWVAAWRHRLGCDSGNACYASGKR